MRYHIEFYRDRRKRWRCRIVHRNGHVILVTSEGDGYARRADCLRAVCRVLDAPKEAFRVAGLAIGGGKGRRR